MNSAAVVTCVVMIMMAGILSTEERNAGEYTVYSGDDNLVSVDGDKVVIPQSAVVCQFLSV